MRLSYICFFFKEGNHSGLTISVGDNSGRKCYSGLFPENTGTIFCNRVLKTKILNITFDLEIEVQEVEVYGGKIKSMEMTRSLTRYVHSAPNSNSSSILASILI
ncbi:hypothetical protein MHBO_003445 [Bonamia ostreae]|uniref:Uncharacterized protein n=1 Tax=Bonamia ostreae TaxID=126728 RepID=A0ABV2AQG2_9EUKA